MAKGGCMHTSKIMLIVDDIWMISLLGRHSFLLSSSTVFMFSIHRASTGPSRTSHLRAGLGSVASCLKATARTPSCTAMPKRELRPTQPASFDETTACILLDSAMLPPSQHGPEVVFVSASFCLCNKHAQTIILTLLCRCVTRAKLLGSEFQ